YAMIYFPLGLAAAMAISPRLRRPGSIALIAALGFPAVLVNFLHGQNGFLTAALLGGGLALLNRKQALAGVLIGLLAYKPQFGVLIPLALAAGGYWRAFGAAAATVIALAAFSTAIFGVEIWQAFFESRHYTKGTILEAGATGWEKIQSVFSALRMWGAPVWLAYAAQAGAALALGACVIAVWRSGVDFGLKAATLMVASLLATPYSLDYDLMALGPAIAFFAAYGLREGFHPYEKSLLALAWLCPIAARPAAELLMVPLGLAATTLFFLAIMRRAGIGLDVRRAAKPVAPA
ncbi:MAG: glycosyltransferase family 87 protein, partial [Pseudomonadota bacterium]